MQAIKERVDSLEAALESFIAHTESLSRDIDRLVEENEKSRKRSDKIDERLDKLGERIDRMSEEDERFRKENEKFREENERFREENEKSREEGEKQRKEMNKQWAALAQKMGTLDEDLVAPAVRPVLNKYFNCDFTARTIRVIRRMGGEEFEVDVLAVSEDKVFMIEVNSSPRTEYVDQIIDKASKFKEFFPEYGDKELIIVYASIIFPENVLKYATRRKLYVMAYREWEYMDIINFDEIRKAS